MTASGPLSPNAFVQIPTEEPVRMTSRVDSSAQKRMRVPRGGNVERPKASRPRPVSASVPFQEPPATRMQPSLRIFLEEEPEPEAADASREEEEQAESLAQFVASFPKIPDKLIFKEGEEPSVASDEQQEAPKVADDGVFDIPDAQDPSRTIRLDMGDLPEDPGFPDMEGSAQDHIGYGRPVREQAEERVVPANPRFEKLIREASSTGSRMRQPYPYPQGSASPSPARDRVAAGPRVPATSGNIPLQHSPMDATRQNGRVQPRNAAMPNGPRSSAFAQSGRPQAISGNLPNRPASPSPSVAASRMPSGVKMSQQVANRPVAATVPKPVATPMQQPLKPVGVAPKPSLAPTPIAAKPHHGSDVMAHDPLIDSDVLEESTMFDAPPISIEEGMKDADKSHKTGRKLLIGVLVLIILALGAAVAFFAVNGSVGIPEITISTSGGSSDGQGSSSTQASSDAAGPSQEDAGASGAATGGAGSVTYQYTAKTPQGVEYTVEESTTFNNEGKCTFTTMKMQFPNEDAAKTFTDSLARDLGSKYTLDSMNGANATVTVDNSGLGLDREDYENALRYSVEDLVILKK
ncbi:MAG: hypothetical protein HFJ65_01945 [Eggerthellaceae bacterium]|nr:hypothetical protein [Eggerthellaceae bacterium]